MGGPGDLRQMKFNPDITSMGGADDLRQIKVHIITRVIQLYHKCK